MGVSALKKWGGGAMAPPVPPPMCYDMKLLSDTVNFSLGQGFWILQPVVFVGS